MEKIHTTFRLPPDEHRQLRVAAAQRHLTIQQALTEAARLWLAMCGTPVPHGVNGSPYEAKGRVGSEQEHSHDQG
jgi:hypothetical protein